VNAPLRKAGVVIFILFGLLFANLNWIQVYKGNQYRTDEEHNRIRVQQYEYERQRGQIIVDGEAVADSVATKDTLKFRRTYPFGPVYSAVVGYRPVNLAATGIERLENEFLSGNADALAADRLLEMITGKESKGGNVVLTIRKQVQEAAYQALLNNSTKTKNGAVVAIDPVSGAILGMVSTPGFDPNPLVSHDYDEASAAAAALEKDPNKPLMNRALSEIFAPGSTFKVIVAAAALANGATPDTMIQGGDSYTAPGTTTPIRNATGVVCPEQISLRDALRVSCNTAFARYAVEHLGADKVKEAARAFGFEDAPLIDKDPDNIMRVAASQTGSMLGPSGVDEPALAQSAIGQRDVAMTPLQGALIAAAIANNGIQMRPYLIDSLKGPDLSVIEQAKDAQARRPVSPEIAAALQQMMDGVVTGGTGTRAQIDGYEVGGKTGTAQNGNNAPDHGWFIGYARKNGQPIVAVAVFLQNAGSGGSSEAARIAGQVMQAAIAAGTVR
jgi:peptidoglycan glycosyltransferase